MIDRVPFEAALFTPGALLQLPTAAGGGAGPGRPGVRRLVAALGGRGVPTAVVVDAQDGPPVDEVTTSLDAAGLQELVVQAGVPESPGQTLVIRAVSDPWPAAWDDTTFAGVVTLTDGLPPLAAVAGWLAEQVGPFESVRHLVVPVDDVAVAAATERHLQLTKPPGSLGRLEDIGVQLAGIAGQVPPPTPRPASLAVFAADHGVHAQGVSPWPQEVTAQMVANFVTGGAAVNVLARHVGADVTVVDVGVAASLPAAPELLDRKVARGTRDLSQGPAMTVEQALQAADAGAEVALDLVAAGARCLLTGDMGIANTTASAALVSSLTKRAADQITGRGAGLPPADLPHKATVVAEAAARARARHGDDPLAVLAEVGGFEHAALAGFITAGAAAGVPVIVDGVIAAAALLVAARLVPGVERLVVAGHRSVEPGSTAVLDTLGLAPVVDLDLRLGEGTGAALALPVVQAAARVLGEMATFDQAGVSSKE